MMRPIGRITVTEDRSVPTGGYALVRVHGAAGHGQGVGLFVRRLGYEDNNLGAEGWQGPESPWTPLSVGDDGLDLVMRIGPDIVDRIEVGQPIELEVAKLGLRIELPWPDITPSSSSRAGRSRTRVSRPRTRTPLPPVVPEPSSDDEDMTPPEGSETIPTTPEPPEEAPPEPPAESRAWLWVLLVVLLLLVVLGAGAWFLRCDLRLPWIYPGDAACGIAPPEDPAPPPEPPVPEPETPPEPATDTETGDPPPAVIADPVPPQPPPIPDSERIDRLDLPCDPDIDVFTCVRQLQDLSERERFEIAMRALDLGDLDIAIVLLRQLGTDGHGPALREIGRMYDPTYYGPETSVFSAPDINNARRYYDRATEAGDDQAGGLRGRLP